MPLPVHFRVVMSKASRCPWLLPSRDVEGLTMPLLDSTLS